MPDGIEIKITGIRELNKSLYRYSQQLGDRVMISSLREGAKLVQKAARGRAPKKTGLVRRSIVVRKSKIYTPRKKPGFLGVYLTISKKKGKGFYGRFLNDGWNTHGKRGSRRQIRSISIGGPSGRTTLPGKTNVRGLDFIGKAWRSTKGSAVKLIIRSMQRGEAIVRRKTRGIR